MSKILITLLLTSLAVTAGANGQQQPEPVKRAPLDDAKDLNKKDAEKKTEVLPTAGTGAPVNPNTYEIGSEDVIFVSVWHDQDFTRMHLVRPDGKITLPLIGEIQAAGQTPAQLGKVIAEKLSSIIRDPQVDVSVQQVNSKRYYIQGEVLKPGPFPLVVPTRVLEALTNAGGFKDFANRKKITILRKGTVYKFNYNDVIKGKKMEQNILLENGDYIIVPE